MTIVQTAKKLGVVHTDYIFDRVSNTFADAISGSINRRKKCIELKVREFHFI